MPDVGLTSAAEPLDPKYKVVIKYTIEVEGLAIYSESYDVAKLRKEIKEDEQKRVKIGSPHKMCCGVPQSSRFLCLCHSVFAKRSPFLGGRK